MAVATEQILGGQVALVTGASRGIGAAIAANLADAGARVAVGYRSQVAAAESVVARLGRGAAAFAGDLTDQGEAHALVDAVAAHYGRLDTLVLNAGVWRGGRIDELSLTDWQLVLDSCLTSTYHVAHRAVPLVRASPRGRVVVVTSAIGLSGFAGDGAYASAKAGLIGLVRSLAKELGRDGVTVNAVAPGFIETDMTAAVSDRSRDAMLQRAAVRRPGTVEDVASAVRYLVTEADYVTGHVLVVDGGMTL